MVHNVTADTPCPAVKVGGPEYQDPKGESLNLGELTRATWFSQEQQLTSYQSEEDLYCVTASYSLAEGLDKPVIFENASSTVYTGPVIKVENRHSNSTRQGTSRAPNFPTCARQPAHADTGIDAERDKFKFLVGPCASSNALSGDYWAAHLEYDENYNYTAMAVMAGQPTVKSVPEGTCTTPTTGDGSITEANGQGLWILTRDRNPDPSLIKAVKANLKERGIDLSKLKIVTQNGCDYAGRLILDGVPSSSPSAVPSSSPSASAAPSSSPSALPYAAPSSSPSAVPSAAPSSSPSASAVPSAAPSFALTVNATCAELQVGYKTGNDKDGCCDKSRDLPASVNGVATTCGRIRERFRGDDCCPAKRRELGLEPKE